MTRRSILEYAEAARGRYFRSAKKEKTKMLVFLSLRRQAAAGRADWHVTC